MAELLAAGSLARVTGFLSITGWTAWGISPLRKYGFPSRLRNTHPSSWEIRNMRSLGIAVALGVTLAGCAIQRAQVAQDARAQMVELSKEQVLGCICAWETLGAVAISCEHFLVLLARARFFRGFKHGIS
jgi:hypothetical protein